MADLFIIGRYEDDASTTAVSIGSQVMHILTVMTAGLVMGATAGIGRAVGGGFPGKSRNRPFEGTLAVGEIFPLRPYLFGGEVQQLPQALCVRIRFRGSHAQAPEQYEKLTAYIAAHQMEVAGFSREITMIDYGLTNDLQKFITEISIPVKME